LSKTEAPFHFEVVSNPHQFDSQLRRKPLDVSRAHRQAEGRGPRKP
jgi:hypothetical protein